MNLSDGQLDKLLGATTVQEIKRSLANRGAVPTLPQSKKLAAHIETLAARINERTGCFVRTDIWKGRTVLRISIISNTTTPAHTERLADHIETIWKDLTST